MGYYLKIAFNGKIKKFIVHNSKQINVKQIKNIFTPPIPSNRKLIFTITLNSKQTVVIESEQKFIDYFATRHFQEKETVRVEIKEEKQKKSQCSEDQQFYQQFIANGKICKTRSHSEELQVNLITNQFSVYQTQELFLYQSMKENSYLLQEAKNLIEQKQKQIVKIKEQNRETDLSNLIQFLYRRQS